ncbi:DUF2867 domain-containing protein [Balneolaceae bacterium ANBcel3]|nr:DUF2867 domain-containing protein [Balneolaceae bacterium ANBcel3]
MIAANKDLPLSSLLQKQSATFDYVDSYQSQVTDKEQALDINRLLVLFLTSGPRYADVLLTLRDRVVNVFGLKTSIHLRDEEVENERPKYEIGERAGMFRICDLCDHEMILGENDKHLNFRVSLLMEPGEQALDKKVAITTAVTFNNFFGKLYFFPVKPIHRILVKSTLKNMVEKMNQENFK